MNIVVNETNHSGMHNDGLTVIGGDKIMIVHGATDMNDTDQTSTNGIVASKTIAAVQAEASLHFISKRVYQ